MDLVHLTGAVGTEAVAAARPSQALGGFILRQGFGRRDPTAGGSGAGSGGSRKAGIDPDALSLLKTLQVSSLVPRNQCGDSGSAGMDWDALAIPSSPPSRPKAHWCPRWGHRTTAGAREVRGGVSPPKHLRLLGVQGWFAQLKAQQGRGLLGDRSPSPAPELQGWGGVCAALPGGPSRMRPLPWVPGVCPALRRVG